MARLQRGPRTFAQTPEISGVRELTRGDLSHLTQARPQGQIQSIRDSHHRIARAVASGISNGEVAAACGISVGRVTALRQDPSFVELVAHYRGMLTAEWIKEADPVIELLGSVRTKALAMIEDKIDDAAEKNEFLPSRDLATFAELGLDRTGYGKVNKNVNINVDFAAKLEAARNRSAGARAPRQIEAPMLAPSGPQSGPVDNHAPTGHSNPPAPNFRRI